RLLQRCKSSLVVWMIRHFRNILDVLHRIIRTHDKDCAREEAQFLDERSVRLAERGVAVIGEELDVLDAGRLTKASLRKRKVDGDPLNLYPGQLAGFFVKAFCFRVTGGCVE